VNNLLLGVIFCFLLLTHSVSYGASHPHNNNKPLRIAVSSNFSPVLSKILPSFIAESGIKSEIISGSSGTLYQQIMHGAPYDLFLSADHIHPQRLASDSLIIKNSLQTYTIGQLAFWTSNKQPNQNKNLQAFLSNYSNSTQKIAIANPKTAPYGYRAFETLNALKLWDNFKGKIITGINVNQTFQQIRSLSVPAGFVALSQLKINNLQGVIIPENLYSPILQKLVVLKSSKNIEAAKQFSTFLLRKDTQEKIAQYGYKKIHLQNTLSQKLSETSL